MTLRGKEIQVQSLPRWNAKPTEHMCTLVDTHTAIQRTFYREHFLQRTHFIGNTKASEASDRIEAEGGQAASPCKVHYTNTWTRISPTFSTPQLWAGEKGTRSRMRPVSSQARPRMPASLGTLACLVFRV
jgi:hypothetical protein